MIKELLAQGLDEEAIVAICTRQLGMTEGEARFVFALETGRVVGDNLVIGEDGSVTAAGTTSAAADAPPEPPEADNAGA